MSDQNGTIDQWLVFGLADQKYALNVEYVRELTPAKDHTICSLPQVPGHFVGVLSLRDTAISVLDLRTLLGLPSLAEETEEIVQMLTDREQDHVNWLTELKLSVDEGREFKLARDPHQCKFGRWYDPLMADADRLDKLTNGDIALHGTLGMFAAPHARIHGIASQVTKLVEDGKAAEAHSLIEQVRDTDLAAMIRLFDRVRNMIRELRSSLIVVLQHDDHQIGVQVDVVDSVVRINSDQIEPLPGRVGTSTLVSGLAKMEGTDALRMIIDGAQLFDEQIPEPAGEVDPAATNLNSRDATLAMA